MQQIEAPQLTSRQILGPGGIGREVREPQIAMSELIEEALRKDSHAIIEAGTGTGKGFGYLVPLILYCVREGKSAVVSTANLALQQQLFEKDLPFLERELRDRYNIRFTYTLIKGRSNYLCQERHDKSGFLEGRNEIDAWRRETQTGDRQEIDFPISDRDWEDIKSDSDACSGKDCRYRGDYSDTFGWRNVQCFYYKARGNQKTVHIAVTNHMMVAMDLRFDGRLLGDYDVLCLDEAHQFEGYMLKAMNEELKRGSVQKLIRTINDEFDDFEDGKPLMSAFDALIDEVVKMNPEAQDKYKLSLNQHQVAIYKILEVLERTEEFIHRRRNPGSEKHDAMISKVGKMAIALLQMQSHFRDNSVTWIESYENFQTGKKDWALLTGPVHVAPFLKEKLLEGEYRRKTILASATISAGGTFDYIKGELGIETNLSMIADSPFDYEKNAVLYVPRDIDPTQERINPYEYQRLLHDRIAALLDLSHGHAFCLFTSYKAMKAAFEALTPTLPYPAMMQGQKGKGALIEWFTATPNAVLFATKSFWEGVSVEGQQLRNVIINKIPFPGPGDPQRDEKARELEVKRFSPFQMLDLPEAILDIKQGFGRLIRTQSDRGMVAILDSRLHTKRYGPTILRSLPAAKLITSLEGEDLSPYFN